MELADAVGVSYQQIQKYENEKTSLTLDRFFLIAKALGIQAQTLLPEQSQPVLSEKRALYSPSRDERTLLRLYRGVRDAATRRSVLRLLESIAERKKDAEA